MSEELRVEGSSRAAAVAISEPGVPVDAGLAGLGLVLSLAGSVWCVVATGVGTLAFVTLVLSGGGMHGVGTPLLVGLIVVTASLLRSWAQRAAGDRLLYDGPGTPRSALHRYFVLAGAQTALVGVVAIGYGVAAAPVACLVFALAGWPVALAVVLAGDRFRALLDEQVIPQGADRGFEGAAILMVVLGLTGLLFGVVMAIGTLHGAGELLGLAPFLGIGLITITALMIVRSAMHVHAGIQGLRRTDCDGAATAATRYANAGMLTGVGVGGLLFLLMIAAARGRVSGVGIVIGLSFVLLLIWGLAVWPRIVHRFFADRQFASLEANQGHGRAADRGLTALGWLLFGQAVLGLAMVLPALLSAGEANDERREPLMQMFGALHAGGASPWWSIGMAALQLAVGWQLIHMRKHHDRIATVWAIAAALIAAYYQYPMILAVTRQGAGELLGGDGMLSSVALLSVAMSLIAPIATLILVRRTQRELPGATLVTR